MIPFQLPSDPVRAAAEQVERAIARRIEQAWLALVRSSDPKGAMAEFEQEVRPVAGAVMRAYAAGRHALLTTLPSSTIRKDDTDTSLSFSFDRLAPQTQDAADLFAAQFVREVTADTRQMIAGTVQTMISQGASVPRTAQAVRESIGLTQRQAAAVANYRTMLMARAPDALDRALRDRRFDQSLAQHIAGTKPLSAEQIDKQVAAYHGRYLSFRAKTIARFESLFASNSGAIGAIRSSVSAGLLPAGTRKAWLVAHDERLCPRCRSIPEIQPDGVPLDAQFQWRVASRHGGSSGTIDTAPLHVLCRCTVTFKVMK